MMQQAGLYLEIDDIVAYTVRQNENMKNEIFGINDLFNRLVKYDDKLRPIICYDNKSYGGVISFSISYDENYLYVGDTKYEKIRRFTFDLEPLENIKIACKTNSLAISEKLICVNDNEKGVHFYDKNNHKLIRSLDGSFGIISYMHSKFIVPCPKVAKILCFSTDDAVCLELIKVRNEIREYIKESNDGCIFSDDSFLYCVSVSKNCILKFKIH
jgi:hypothetical protein